MSTFDDPNRESIGLEPIWAGAGEADEVAPRFDPGAHTVAEVEEYIIDHPAEADAVLGLERDGKARVTLVGGDEE